MSQTVMVLISISIGIFIGVVGHGAVAKETGPSRETVKEWALRLREIVLTDAQVAKEKISAIAKDIEKEL